LETQTKRRRVERKGDEGETSLRSWLRQLKTADQLRHITAEVDWDQEIGALTRITMALHGPALLFENIKDHQQTRGTKLMTAGMSNKAQVCLMLGIPVETSDREIVRRLKSVDRTEGRLTEGPFSGPPPSRRSCPQAQVIVGDEGLQRDVVEERPLRIRLSHHRWAPPLLHTTAMPPRSDEENIADLTLSAAC
jgi:hypothetical protein